MFAKLFPLNASAKGGRQAQQIGRLTFITTFKEKQMAKKLYVGGLSYSTTDDGLRDSFAQAGSVVSAAVVTDKFSGRSRGFGFVEMGSDEEAQAAIDMWNGKELDGRTITVSEARPPKERTERRGGGFHSGGYNDRGGDRQRSNW